MTPQCVCTQPDWLRDMNRILFLLLFQAAGGVQWHQFIQRESAMNYDCNLDAAHNGTHAMLASMAATIQKKNLGSSPAEWLLARLD